MIVRERATREGVRVSLASDPGVDDGHRRRAPDRAGDLQPALERGQVHAGGRDRRRRRGARRWRGAGLGQRHRAGHRPGGPGRGSSRSSSRPTRARSSARGRASGWHCPSASSNCTAGGSGSRAKPGQGSTFVFTLPVRPRIAMAGEQILVVEDNDEEHEAVSRRAPGDRLSHAGGIDRRTGADPGDGASTRRSC